MDRFPLDPQAAYTYRQHFTTQHRGIDIMAPAGTHVIAVEDGIAWATLEPKGGNVVYLDGANNRYFYGHLWTWAPSLVMTNDPKVAVKSGDHLGYVGSTGNAAGVQPHLHFQIRRGSLVIDPYPEIQAVDPHPERGSPGETVRKRKTELPTMFTFPDLSGAAVACFVLWLLSRGSR